MKFDKIFDMATAAYKNSSFSTTIGDKTVSLDGSQLTHALHKSIQAFIYSATKEVEGRKIQAFSGSDDLPALTKDVFNTTMQVNNYDMLWQDAFRGVQLQQGQLSWEIATVDSGLAFKQIPEGGKIEYKGIGGEKVVVDVLKYGAGLGITWETMEGRKLYKFVETMEDARAKLFNLWANVHYGLLAAAGLNNQVAWQLTTSESTLERDIATLTKGADDCGSANKDKGYGDTANARFLLYTSPKLRTRVNQALRVTSADMARGNEGQIVDANIDPRYTYNSSIPANKGLLVLPGNKIQNAAYMQERQLSREEQESLNKLVAVWTAFGATVADTDQVYELAFA